MTANIHNQPPEVPVLCYPNCGSSLVAGILHHLGVHMGSRLKQAQQINPRGLYEDEAFSDILGKIWFLYNISPEYQRRIDQEKLLTLAKRYQSDLAAVVKKKQQAGIAWGVKEPRLSLLWPLLREHLKNPRWIIVCRDLERLARSRHTKLNNRFSRHRLDNILYYLRHKQFFTILSYLTNAIRFYNISEQELKNVIVHYYALLDSFTAGSPRLKIQYEDLVEQPAEEIEKIIDFLSIQPDREQFEAALAFVTPHLLHY